MLLGHGNKDHHGGSSAVVVTVAEELLLQLPWAVHHDNAQATSSDEATQASDCAEHSMFHDTS